mgnify:FL=1
MKNLIPANTDISPSLDRHFEGKLSNNSVARVLTAFKSLLTDESLRNYVVRATESSYSEGLLPIDQRTASWDF